MNILLQDLRYGLRVLSQSPGFTTVVVLALALGIGANSAIFSVVNAVLLRALPYEDPDRLMFIWGYHPQIGREAASLPDFVDWRDQSQSFERMAAATRRAFNLTGGEEPERLAGAAVTADFFPVMRVQPLGGRAFRPEEDRPGAPRVAVLSQGLWQRRFGSDPHLIGQSLTLNGESYTVVGIAPAHLQLPSGAELWVPLAADAKQAGRRNDFLLVLGRLKLGVSPAQARADLLTITARLEQQYPQTNSGWRADIVPLHEQIVGNIRPTLLVLLGTVGCILLIACANVANLLLARAATRQREIAIRMALGAGRMRLLRQLLTESVLLAVVGGAFGLLLAHWGLDLLVSLSPEGTPRLHEIKIDGPVLGFTLLLSLLTALLFGMAPAWQASKPDLNESLKEGGRGATAGSARHRLRSLLVVAEVALALMVLIGAGLTVKSFYKLVRLDLGFNRDHLLTMQVPLPRAKYGQGPQVVAFYQQLLERVRAFPGVVSAAAVSPLPWSGGANTWSFYVEGHSPPPPGQVVDANILTVGDRYLETMQVPLLKGRDFTRQDTGGGPPVALINQTLARRYFRDEDPIGRRITFGDPKDPKAQWLTIAGVVTDVQYKALEDQTYPAIYVPHAVLPSPNMTLVIRAGHSPLALASAVRNEVRSLDKDLPVVAIRTMDQVLAAARAPRRFAMLLLSLFSGVALVLAVVGIYGVISYTVAERTHEIGIRMTLGAEPRDVLKLVVGQGSKFILMGVALGLAGALALTRFLSSLLYGVRPTDPLTFAGVAALLAAVALLACYLPARRATKVDPMVALRYE